MTIMFIIAEVGGWLTVYLQFRAIIHFDSSIKTKKTN